MRHQTELLEQIRNRMELRPDTFSVKISASDLPFWFWNEIKEAGYDFTWKNDTLTLKLSEF